MSFSGRRVSILRPSNRRFSLGKELSTNGASLGFFAFVGQFPYTRHTLDLAALNP